MLTNDISVPQLAEMTGYSQRTIRNNLSASAMSKFVVSALAEALDIDISDFEEGSN